MLKIWRVLCCILRTHPVSFAPVLYRLCFQEDSQAGYVKDETQS